MCVFSLLSGLGNESACRDGRAEVKCCSNHLFAYLPIDHLGQSAIRFRLPGLFAGSKLMRITRNDVANDVANVCYGQLMRL